MCPRSRDSSGLFDTWHGDTDPWGLVQAFQMLDRDGNGAINCEDLSAFFGGCVGQTLSTKEASSMIALADLNGDGMVGLEEFQQLMGAGGGSGGGSLLLHRQQEEEQAALRAVFNVLDVNKDGKLGREDLRYAMAMSGQPLSEEELDAMVGAAAGLQAPSSRPSASISFDTFSKLMSSF